MNEMGWNNRRTGLFIFSAVAFLQVAALAERSVTPFVAIAGSPTAAEVERKLDALAAVGIDSFLFYPTSGMRMEYLGEDFFRCAADFARGAERRGMKMWLYDEYNWPSGSCRGRVPSENERWRYAEVSYHRNPTGGVDRVVSHGPRGWVSLLEPDAVDRFIELTYGAYERHLGAWIGNGTIVGVFTDEPGHPVKVKTPPDPISRYRWWSTLPEDYRAETGHDFDADASAASVDVAAYARLLGRRFRTAYYDRVRKVTDAWGISFCGHLICDDLPEGALRYNGDPLLALRGESFPGIDEIWSVVEPDRIPFFLYALADHAIARGGCGGMAELFACGPADMSPERMRRMIWLCALHGVTRYFTVMSAMDTSWMEQMRGFTTVVGEYQPWFPAFRTLLDEADRARTFAGKKCVRDAAVRYPQDLIARSALGRGPQVPVGDLLREIELDGFTPELIRAEETTCLPVVFSFRGQAIVEERSGRRFGRAEDAVAYLASVRPVGGRHRNVLLRRYEDGTRAELDLTPIVVADPPDALPVKADWRVSLDAPNRHRLAFDTNGVARLRLKGPLTNVVFAVRRHVPVPELEDSPLIEQASMCEGRGEIAAQYKLSLDGRPLSAVRACTCLRPGLDSLYGMTDPVGLPAGEHALEIVSGRADDNFFLPVAVVAGNFRETAEGLVQDAGNAGLGRLSEKGLSGFAGVATYTAAVDVPAGCRRLVVSSGNAFTQARLGGVDLGCLAWSPFAWNVPPSLAGGRRLLEIRIATSFLPLFGNPDAPESRWKRRFYQPPQTPESAPGLQFVGFQD